MAPTKAKARGDKPAAQHDVFPTFTKDGDVKVIVTGARQYQLHSNVLKNNSPVMRKLLASVEPAQLTNKLVKNGFQIRYRLMLVHNTEENASPEYIFEAVPLDSNARPIHGNPEGIGQDFENGRSVSPTVLAFNTVLGAFYNVPIDFGNAFDDSLSELLDQALKVTMVAEYLRCIHIITPPIESTLLATGQNLYRAIGNNPVAWLSFAFRVRSKAIFKEALIHAAGQYHTPNVRKAIDKHELPDKVIKLLQAKGEFIEGSVQTAEQHLASYYPSVLMRESTVGRVDRDNIGRANYANDIMMWIALSIFRHWTSNMFARDLGHNAPDIGWNFINAVAAGGDKYLPKQQLQLQFHARFPMSPKGMACVEHRLAEIKDVVKQWAKPLMRSHALLDIRRYPVEYFTCVNVTNQDFPWSDDPAEYEEETDAADESAPAREQPEPRQSSKASTTSTRKRVFEEEEDSDDNEAEDEGEKEDEDEDQDMDDDNDAASLPALTDGASTTMSVDRLGNGDLEEDTVDVKIADDDSDSGRQTAANTLARLRNAEAQPVPPALRRSFVSDHGGDTEPETDTSYQAELVEEARQRRLEREAARRQGDEALNAWVDREMERTRHSEGRIAAASRTGVNESLSGLIRGGGRGGRRGGSRD